MKVNFNKERIVNTYKRDKSKRFRLNGTTEFLNYELVMNTKIDKDEFNKKKVYFMRIHDLDNIKF